MTLYLTLYDLWHRYANTHASAHTHTHMHTWTSPAHTHTHTTSTHTLIWRHTWVHLRSKGSISDRKGPSQIERVHLRSKGSISDQKDPSQIKERQHMLSQRRVFSMTLWHVHTHAHTHAHNAKIKHYVRYDYIIYIQVQWIKMNWGTTWLTLRLPFNFNHLWSSCRVSFHRCSMTVT